MKTPPILIVITILIIGTGISAFSQTITDSEKASPYPKATIPNTEVRSIHSSIVGEDYEITIALPPHYEKSTTTYGVLYAPDEWLFFKSILDSYNILGLGGEMPPLVIVGIGFPNSSTDYDTIRSKVRDLRTRDLTPFNVDSLNTPSMLARGVKSGGGDKFLSFIKQELIPFIEKNYRVSKEDKTLVGYSYGGLFCIYTLFHSPETFSRYLIGSPSIKYGNENNIAIPFEKAYATKYKDLKAKVFLSLGSLEGEDEVEKIHDIEKTLLNRNYNGLTLKTWVFEGETHLSAAPGTISRGLHELFIAK